MSDLPGLIASVFKALQAVGQPEAQPPAAAPVPAVPIRKSVGQEFIICLEEGKKMTMLKRHLATDHQLTPQQYRQRWGLPKDYPMWHRPTPLAARTSPGRSGWAASPPHPRARSPRP